MAETAAAAGAVRIPAIEGDRVHVTVPDDILRKAEANATDVVLAVAIQLYADNRIDYTDALRMSNLPRVEFNRELVTRGIGIHLNPPARARRRAAG